MRGVQKHVQYLLLGFIATPKTARMPKQLRQPTAVVINYFIDFHQSKLLY
jgi:hypothetical protein